MKLSWKSKVVLVIVLFAILMGGIIYAAVTADRGVPEMPCGSLILYGEDFSLLDCIIPQIHRLSQFEE